MKICPRCGQDYPADAKHFNRKGKDGGLGCYCKWCARKYNKLRWAQQHDHLLAKNRLYQQANRERLRSLGRIIWKRDRTACLQHYSHSTNPICACCGESTEAFLTIDHINGGGHKHRKQIGRHTIYAWLRRNGFPLGFQVLCMNCNFAKGKLGTCPHQIKR